MRFVVVLGVIAGLVFAAFMTPMIARNVSADEYWQTIFPVAEYSNGYHAYNLAWSRWYPNNLHNFTDPGPDPGEYAFMRYSGSDPDDSDQYIHNHDFTGTPPVDYDYYDIIYPESNATIEVAFVVAVIQCDWSRSFQLSYSVGKSSTIYLESGVSSSMNVGTTHWTMALWNVTGEESWTYDMVSSATLWAGISSNDMTSTALNVAYVGFYFIWTQPGTGEGWIPEYPEFEPEEEGAWGESEIYSFFLGDGIIGILGAMGFIGMVAVPAYAVWAARSGDEPRLITGVKALVLMLFFFALFLASIMG